MTLKFKFQLINCAAPYLSKLMQVAFFLSLCLHLSFLLADNIKCKLLKSNISATLTHSSKKLGKMSFQQLKNIFKKRVLNDQWDDSALNQFLTNYKRILRNAEPKEILETLIREEIFPQKLFNSATEFRNFNRAFVKYYWNRTVEVNAAFHQTLKENLAALKAHKQFSSHIQNAEFSEQFWSLYLGHYQALFNDTFNTIHHIAPSKSEKIGFIIDWIDAYFIWKKNPNTLHPKIQLILNSPSRCQFAYEFLQSQKQGALIKNLAENHPFFKEAQLKSWGDQHSFLTYSFEREFQVSDFPEKSAAGEMFKPLKLKKENWQGISADEKQSELSQVINSNNGETMYQTLELNRPDLSFLSPLKKDFDQGQNVIWEVTNASYELSTERLFDEISIINKIVTKNESFQGFHIHVVFDEALSLLKNKEKFRKFGNWYTSLNQYLYIKGVEEGMHSSEMIKFLPRERAPKKYESIEGWDFKFFTVGLRKAYGTPSNLEQMARIGLELRDVSRNFSSLKNYVKNISNVIQNQLWLKTDGNHYLQSNFKSIKVQIAQILAKNINEPSLTEALDKTVNKQSLQKHSLANQPRVINAQHSEEISNILDNIVEKNIDTQNFYSFLEALYALDPGPLTLLFYDYKNKFNLTGEKLNLVNRFSEEGLGEFLLLWKNFKDNSAKVPSSDLRYKENLKDLYDLANSASRTIMTEALKKTKLKISEFFNPF